MVAAAGNRGAGDDAVSYAPGNDPYVVTVGAVDDKGTKEIADDDADQLVEPRHDAGRLREARHLRAGRPHRLQPRAGQRRSPRCAPTACSDGGEYIRAGGTSMAAPMVAGAAAIGFQLDPTLTPNRIKALLRDSDRPLTDSIDELSMVDAARRFFDDGGKLANQGLEPNTFIDPATGEIDYTRSSWSRSSLERGGRAAALELEPLELEPGSGLARRHDSAAVDTARSSWSRSSWSTSWTK